MGKIVDLLNRPTYGLAQIDSLLGLQAGTARRWIDGYRRGGKLYDPVVREHSTGEEIATWGEFIETRLLAEYRDAGVPMIRMRPAVEALREELKVPYPLASARMWLRPEGRDLVRVVEERVGLDSHLGRVLPRSNNSSRRDCGCSASAVSETRLPGVGISADDGDGAGVCGGRACHGG